MKLFLVGFLVVLCGGSAMTLHKLYREPILEITFWVITLIAFLVFEYLLRRDFPA